MFILLLATSLLSTPFAAIPENAPFYQDKLHLLTFIDAQGQAQPVKTPTDWNQRRVHILANMQRVMGALPADSLKVPLDMQIMETTDMGIYIQNKITFAVESEDRVPAYLLIPKNLDGKAPALLCLHPTSPHGKGMTVGLGELPHRNYAQELAQRGYITLAPDYPGFGDYVAARKELYRRGYKSCTMKGIWNHMRAVDLLQSLPQVDPDRIGCIGHSLGGHNTLFLGVFDPRVKVMVTSSGFNTFSKYYGGDLTGWTHDGYMPAIASEYGKDPKRLPFDFPEILAALAPRWVFINAPLRDANFEVSGVRDCVSAAQPVFDLYGAPNHLVAIYPDTEHDFSDEARRQAYAFIDRALNKE